MLTILTTAAKTLIMLSYLIAGLYLIDIVETRFIYMTHFDILVCTIGSIFILISFYILYILSCVNK